MPKALGYAVLGHDAGSKMRVKSRPKVLLTILKRELIYGIYFLFLVSSQD